MELLQQSQLQDRPFAGELGDAQRRQPHHGKYRQCADHVGIKPLITLAFLQHDRQAAQPDGHADDAGPIRFHQFVNIGFLVRHADQQQADQADGHGNVDEEAPLPAAVLGKPAAEHGTHQRSEQHDEAEHRHADRNLVLRQTRADQRLGGRDQCAAEEALADATDHHGRQIVTGAAHDREDRKQNGAGEQQGAHAQHSRQPRGQRNHHHFADQVAGGDPGALGAGRADLTLNLRQGGVDDGNIQRRDERAQRARDDRNPVLRRCIRVRCAPLWLRS